MTAKAIATISLVLLVSACAPVQPTEERQQIKANCVAGDMSACAEIGHQARREMDSQG